MSQTIAASYRAPATVMPVLGAISVCHMLNDTMQSLLLAIYPLLKSSFHLDFGEIGLLTLVFQVTASLLQPLIGRFTDARPMAYSLPVGMGFTMVGIITLGLAPDYPVLLSGAALLGIGSSIFHPESSRIARLASGGRYGMAQSVFQVGGNFGQSLGPLLAAFLIVPNGRRAVAWCGLVAFVGIGILSLLGRWYKAQGAPKPAARKAAMAQNLPSAQVKRALAVLIALMFSKFFYLASINSYYIFYLMRRFHLPTQAAQVDLFLFLAAAAAGTLVGGPIGDRIGRKRVIWGSIAGVIPFALLLPYASLDMTLVLSVIIGLVLSSAFSAIVVYAQELLPGRTGMVSGLFFGLAFGMGGIGAAMLGELADWTNVEVVYRVCSFLPMLGLLTVLLPDLGSKK